MSYEIPENYGNFELANDYKTIKMFEKENNEYIWEKFFKIIKDSSVDIVNYYRIHKNIKDLRVDGLGRNVKCDIKLILTNGLEDLISAEKHVKNCELKKFR